MMLCVVRTAPAQAQAREAKQRRMLLRRRGHAKPSRRGDDPEADAYERRMLVTATRGVVRLFNAVHAPQYDRVVICFPPLPSPHITVDICVCSCAGSAGRRAFGGIGAAGGHVRGVSGRVRPAHHRTMRPSVRV